MAKAAANHNTGRVRGLAAVVAATLFLFAVLALPHRPQDVTAAAMARLPLELVVIAAALVLVPARSALAVALRVVVTATLTVLLLVKFADLGLHAALARPFNFAYDLPLLHAGWMLAVGASGPVAAALWLAGAAGALLLATGILWWGTGALAGRSPRRSLPVLAILLVFSAALALTGRASLASSELLAAHVADARTARAEIAALEAEAAADDIALPDGAAFLDVLAGRDVVFVFVESYGRSTLDNPLYADTTRDALGDLDRAAARKGLGIRSGFLTAPMVGGQSWLAHASVLSGLWIDSQGRYRAMLASDRKSLMRLASEAGWESVAVMPAITMAWPEGEWFGYDRIFAKDQLGYRGLPFNWVTMPDQYTLSAFERQVLIERSRKPVFAEIALISSHAPWTPVPRLVDWEAVGDGRIFNVQALSGDSPEALWRDHDRVREQFGRSIAYSLRTVASFVDRGSAREPLFVVLGDHQPATFVSGDDGNRDVPVHIIADPETLRAIDHWTFSPGAIPQSDAPVWRMDEFRKRFVESFSKPARKQGDPHEPA